MVLSSKSESASIASSSGAGGRSAAERGEELPPPDHSITSFGAGDQRRRHVEAERLGSLEIDQADTWNA